MNHSRISFATVVVLAAGAAWWWTRPRPSPPPRFVPETSRYVATPPPWHGLAKEARQKTSGAGTDKAARVEKIRRDYDELRSKVAAEYAATGGASVAELKAFLRQVALLESERRKDLLKVLTPLEREELEMRESRAGDKVRRLLGETAATDAQRRAAFRLQQAFDDQYGLTFDLSPGFLLVREQARQALEQQVRGVLGDALFAAWLRGEGTEFATFSDFAANHGLDRSVPYSLWQLRNQYVLGRLEIGAAAGLSPEQIRAAQSALARRIELQARALLGSSLVDPSSQAVLSWLPRP